MATIVDIDPASDPRWDEVAAVLPSPLFVSRPWLGVLGDVYDVTFRARIVEGDGDGPPIGGLAWAELDDPRGARLTSLPFCDVAPVLAADDGTWHLLSDALLEDGRPVSFRTFADPRLLADRRLRSECAAVLHRLDLTEGPDALLQRYHGNTRRLVRRAEREGIRFRVAEDVADLRRFFLLHLAVRRERHRLLAQPFALFEAIWERWLARGEGALVLGWDGGEVVGGCLLITHGDAAYYKFAASGPDHRNLGVNHAAVHAAVAWSAAQGLATLDLGRSDVVQPGLVRFKERFTARCWPLAVHHGGPDPSPAERDAGRVLRELTQLLTEPDVDPGTTEAAGALLYRWFA